MSFRWTMETLHKIVGHILVGEAPLGGERRLSVDEKRRLYAALVGFMSGVMETLHSVDLPRKREVVEMMKSTKAKWDDVYNKALHAVDGVSDVYLDIREMFKTIGAMVVTLDVVAITLSWAPAIEGSLGGLYR